MPFHGVHHVVLNVGDLPAGERFYRDLLALDVRFREGRLDGETGAVPAHLDWEEAVAAGVDPAMSFLGRDEVSLALAAVDPGTGDGPDRLNHVALAVDAADQDAVERRAADLDCETRRHSHSLFVDDPFGVEWELNASSPPPECPFDPLDVS